MKVCCGSPISGRTIGKFVGIDRVAIIDLVIGVKVEDLKAKLNLG